METTYDKIGTGYNSTRQADPYLTERLLDLLKPEAGKRYLDIGCGTGNYTVALANKGVQLTGVDPSEKMLDEARLKHPHVQWLKGSAEQIPASDKSFDGMIATLTIHHWTDLQKAFIEMERVLSDEGKVVLFTSSPEQMKGYWLNHYFPRMLVSSIVQMPSLDHIKAAAVKGNLEVTTIEKYFIKDDLRDGFLYIGKNDPERYFNEKIRHGISSFSSLAHIEEVEQGLSKLRGDIDSRVFERIKEKYENDSGDYLFIVMKKMAVKV